MTASAEKNFAGLLVRRLSHSSRLADAATGLSVSGDDLPASIVGFAAGLLSLGLRPCDRLLIGCGQTLASALAYLGAIYAGIVPVPVEERMLATSGDQLVAKSRSRAVWTEKKGICDSLFANNIIRIAGGFDLCHPASLEPFSCEDAGLAVLMSTSGSTGTPRLVMVSHGNLRSNTEAIIRSQNLAQDETAMLVMPISYCFGASVLHTHLYQGGSVVFDSRSMFVDKVLHAINSHFCSTFAGVPFVYDALLRRSNLKSIPVPSLRRADRNRDRARRRRRIPPAVFCFPRVYGSYVELCRTQNSS